GDLLLTKLQIFAVNEKDQRDIFNLLYGHKLTDDDAGINVAYIAKLCARDWGLWRTATMNIERARGAAQRFQLAPEDEAIVLSRLDDLRKRIDAEPKSAKWKLRARVGERVQWYEDPDEIGGCPFAARAATTETAACGCSMRRTSTARTSSGASSSERRSSTTPTPRSWAATCSGRRSSRSSARPTRRTEPSSSVRNGSSARGPSAASASTA